MNIRLENNSRFILKRLENGIDITDEMLSSLIATLSNYMYDDIADTPKSFYDLCDELHAIKFYRDYKPEFKSSINVGACWGVVQMYLCYEKNHGRPAEKQRLLELIKEYSWLFYAIRRYPGIGLESLASVTSVVSSRITQSITTLKPESLIVEIELGRQRHYTLSSRGEELVKEYYANLK